MFLKILQTMDDSEKFTDIVCSQREFLMKKYFPAREIDSFIFKRAWVSRASRIHRNAIFFVGNCFVFSSVFRFNFIIFFIAFIERFFCLLFGFEGFVASIGKSLDVVFAFVS